MSGLEPAGGVSRRNFLSTIAKASASIGLTAGTARAVARAATNGVRPAVIWLQFQDCTGCTESLLRTSHPGLAEVILDLITLEYHETLMAASGHAAEAVLASAIQRRAGKYLCVVEGAVPEGANGSFLKIAGRAGTDVLREVCASAGAVIAIGSCASWGGVPSAEPNTTGAHGAGRYLSGKPIVTLPGCPANPYIFLGVALQFATFGRLPALDELGRPKFAYSRLIHDHCPRRAHFDAGRFATQFGDEGHRQGYCLYRLGCKGPATRAACSTLHFCDVVDAWPIGLGAPCFGCSEQKLAFRTPAFETVPIDRPAPPDTYAPVSAPQGSMSAKATGLAGLIAGAGLGAAWMAARRFSGPPAPSEQDPPGGAVSNSR